MRPNQVTRLYQWVRRMRGTPFAWGECDCHTLALDWLKLLSGQDCLAEVRGCYASEEEARAYAASRDIDLVDLLVGAGCQRVETTPRIVAGDFILVRSRSLPFMMVHIALIGQAFSVEPDGLCRVWPLRDITRPREVYRWQAPS